MTLDTYPRPSAISEAELFGALAIPGEVARPCVCGTVVVADPRDPTPGVQAHQRSRQHAEWRERREWRERFGR